MMDCIENSANLILMKHTFSKYFRTTGNGSHIAYTIPLNNNNSMILQLHLYR